MGRTQRIWLIIAAALIAVAIGYVSAPFLAFRAIAAGADAEDQAVLARLVDFPAVRASLKVQLEEAQAGTTAPAPSILQDPIGAITGMIRPIAPPPPATDSYLTPAGLAALTRGFAPGGFSAAVSERPAPIPRLAYWDFSRVRLVAVRPDTETRTLFTFERRGPFKWVLVQVRLPPGERAPAPPTPR